jgi:hypothetical protein
MSVDVRPKGQALALQDTDNVPFGDMCRTLEGHVLENMRQALLVVVFVERAVALRIIANRIPLASVPKWTSVSALMSLCVCGHEVDEVSAKADDAKLARATVARNRQAAEHSIL